MEPARLTATDLACRRGERLLFTRLGFALEAGHALQITGPNGTGKSSLLRILAGLLRPTAGAAEHDGALALVDERPALDGELPLGQALAFWRRIDGGGEPPAALGLGSLLDVPVRFLSTGQRKRAALARVASQNAPIWLLDEPLNGLDRTAVAACETLVAGHCAAGGIAVIASHQPFALAGLQSLALADFAP